MKLTIAWFLGKWVRCTLFMLWGYPTLLSKGYQIDSCLVFWKVAEMHSAYAQGLSTFLPKGYQIDNCLIFLFFLFLSGWDTLFMLRGYPPSSPRVIKLIIAWVCVWFFKVGGMHSAYAQGQTPPFPPRGLGHRFLPNTNNNDNKFGPVLRETKREGWGKTAWGG